jgi:thymidylate synthase (FAD)
VRIGTTKGKIIMLGSRDDEDIKRRATGEKVDLLDHGFVRLVDHMGADLDVVRAARTSYNAAWRAGEDEGSDNRLIRYLWKNKHTTPFESVQFTFEVKAPIFVFRQWHRHRTWCLSGDTLISFELPCRLREGIRTAKTMRLDELYRKWKPSQRKDRPERQTNALFSRSKIQGMLLRVYDEQRGEFTTGRICDVIASGVKQVFEIGLADGKKLKCSKDHRLLTTEGWQRLEDAIGLVVVGNTAGMNRKAYVLTNGYAADHVPWNKGVTGYKTKRVVTEEEKAIIREARSGPRSNFWKGGVTPERQNIARWTREQAPKVHAKHDYTCQDCGNRGGVLHAHHVKSVVEHPESARDFDNLATLCERCHDIRHGRKGDRAKCRAKGQTLRAMSSEIVSIRLVGEEPTYDISVDGPNHNFVANGVIVHNSYNELSARYRELPEEVYMPDFRAQSSNNKQGSDGEIDGHVASALRELFESTYADSFKAYRMALDNGVAREVARSVLPVATYSHMFASVNLLNLLKFLTLRCDSHAQHEIRVYADAMRELVRPIVPVCVAAWEAIPISRPINASTKSET